MVSHHFWHEDDLIPGRLLHELVVSQSDLRHLNDLNHRLRGHRRNQLHWTLVIRPRELRRREEHLPTLRLGVLL